MKKTAFVIASLAASTLLLGGTAGAQEGELVVCERLKNPDDGVTAALFRLIGVPISSQTGKVGLNCSPYSGGPVDDGVLARCTRIHLGGDIAEGCEPTQD
jgi:hypothetical protein